MANIITVSMTCFPYVMAGLGQVIIAGTNPTRRTVRGTAEASDRIISFATFDENAQTSRTEDKRCKVCFIPGCPVFASR